MNLIDIILLLIIVFAVWHAVSRGFIESTFEILIWLGSFLSAFFLSRHLAWLLDKLMELPELWIRPISFIILLIFFSWLISSMCDRLLKKISERQLESRINKLTGLIPGLFSGLVYSVMISFFLLAYPVGSMSQQAAESRLAGTLTNRSGPIGEKISSAFYDFGMKLGSGMTIHPKGRETVKLPFRSNSNKVRHDLELKMLEMINTERTRDGLATLRFDEELAQVARKHSRDMLSRAYFSHYTPEGKSPFDRMNEDGIRFLTAGENLALAQNLKLAHQGLMESPGHRANILHRAYRSVGIGIIDGGIHGIIITQNFRN